MIGIRISRNFKKYFLNAQQGKSYFKLIINALNVVWISRKYREILKELNNAHYLNIFLWNILWNMTMYKLGVY